MNASFPAPSSRMLTHPPIGMFGGGREVYEFGGVGRFMNERGGESQACSELRLPRTGADGRCAGSLPSDYRA